MNPDGRTLRVLPSAAGILFRKPGFQRSWSSWIHLELVVVGLSSFVNLVNAFWMKVVELNQDFFSESLPQKWCSLWKYCGFLHFLTCCLSQSTLKPRRSSEAYIRRSRSPAISPCGSIPVQHVVACVVWFVTALFHPTEATVSCRKKQVFCQGVSCFQGWTGQGAASPSSLTLGNVSWVVAAAVK